MKRTVVDDLKVIDVWTTSGKGKSHKKQVIASLRGASEFLWQHFVIYNQHVSRQESRDFIQENLYVRDRREPQTTYQIHVYRSRFLLQDFIFQTSD